MSESTDFTRSLFAARYWMLGLDWHLASGALDFAEQHYRRLREDGITAAGSLAAGSGAGRRP